MRCESPCAPAIAIVSRIRVHWGYMEAQCVGRSAKRGTLVQTYDEMDWEKVQPKPASPAVPLRTAPAGQEATPVQTTSFPEPSQRR